MIDKIPKAIRKRMRYLELLDKRERKGSVPALMRLRQIPRETGKFLMILATMAPKGRYIEIGTSGGYSALWLALACRRTGRKLVTFEVLEEKAAIAQETFRVSKAGDVVKLVVGDARKYLGKYRNVSFCFLDAEKEIYLECYEKLIPNMTRAGLLVADNVLSHKHMLQPMVNRVLRDKRVDALVVPIGSGALVCLKL